MAYSQQADTMSVYFGLKETTVNSKAAALLDKFAAGKIKPGQKISIYGFADYRGTNEHNDSVSTDRAMSVQQYLIGKGVSKEDIMACAGRGKIERPGMTGKYGNAPDRKVIIIINKATTDLDIDKMQVNGTIALKNILFEGGLPDILPSSMPELENLYNFLNEHQKLTISIEGHVCCKGITTASDGPYIDDNGLSKLRAKAVYDYLVSKGIASYRMKYAGYGTTRPAVYPARTGEEQEQNRRVEIRVLTK
jgi:outer membrane protein OmpA-like peptidoglycan-associated protein